MLKSDMRYRSFLMISFAVIAVALCIAVLIEDSPNVSADGIYYDSNNNEYFVDSGTLYVSAGSSGTGVMQNFTSTSNAVETLGITLPFTAVIMDSSMTTVGDYAFDGCSSITSISMPGVTSIIGTGAFRDCSSLEMMSLPSAMTVVQSDTFSGCSSLAIASLPSGLTQISSGAFQNCISLAITSIPSTVTTIGDNAFNGCTSLTSLTINSATPASVGTAAFLTSTLLNVDKSVFPTYLTSWASYSSQIRTSVDVTITNVNVTSDKSTGTYAVDENGFTVSYSNVDRLPEGYTEVEYIQSSGTQYIDTGIHFDLATMTDVEVEYGLLSNLSYDNKFFGSYCGVGLTICSSKLRSTHNGSWGWNLTSMTIGQHTDRFTYDGTDLKLYHDNVLVETVTTGTFTDTVYTMQIGKLAREESYSNYITFKSVSIGNAFNGVPCIRNSDNAVGMYDLISNTFFGNAGTGTFIAGDPVSPYIITEPTVTIGGTSYTDFTFISTVLTIPASAISGDITIAETAALKKYQATIDTDGGTAYDVGDGWTFSSGVYTKMFEYGTTASDITSDFNGRLVKIGFAHNGYDKTTETIGFYGISIKAQWVTGYLATIDLDGGEAENINPWWVKSGEDYTCYFADGTAASTITSDFGATLSKVGHTFGNYDKSAEVIGTGGITITAQWVQKTYSVTLDKGVGSSGGSATATYNYEKLTSIAAPSYTGHHVEGYYTDSSLTIKIAGSDGILIASVDKFTDDDGKWIKDSDVTLCTNWEIDQYTVVFMSQDGTSQLGTASVNYGGTAVYRGETPTKQSTAQYMFEFEGWNTEKGQTSAESGVLDNVTGNKAVYAAFSETLRKYIVTITGEGVTVKDGKKSVVSGTSVDYGTSLLVIMAFRTGHTPLLTANDVPITPNDSYTVECDVTFNGSYTATTYAITLDKGIGSSDGYASAVYNSVSLTSIHPPVYTGYHIEGYYTDSSFTDKVAEPNGSFATGVSGYTDMGGQWIRTLDTILCTKWVANTYAIDLKANGGDTDGSAKATYDGILSDLVNATRVGYCITGYFTAETSGTKVIDSDGSLMPSVEGYTDAGCKWIRTSDVILHAYWTPITYTITFDGNGSDGGTSVPSIAATYDLTYTAPGCSWTRTGYTFVSWNMIQSGTGTSYAAGSDLKNLSAAAGSTVTLYAQWSINTYTVTLISDPISSLVFEYKIDTGDYQTYGTPFFINHGQTLAVKVSSVTGYTFTEWEDHSTDTIRSVTVVGDISWCATSSLNIHTVKYTLDGDIWGSVDSVPYGTLVTVRERAIKVGYDVTEWTSSSVIFIDGKFTMPDCDVIITAVSSPIAYMIAFDGNGSDGGTSVPSIAATYDQTYTAPGCSWTRTGYTFVSWNTIQSGTGTSYAAGSDLKNLSAAAGSTVTLYAQWSINTYTVTLTSDPISASTFTYSIDGGADHEYSVPLGIDHGQTLRVTVTSAKGYSFIEWDDGSKSAVRTSAINGDSEWTAKCIGDPFKVTYRIPELGYEVVDTALCGSIVTVCEKPSVPGYTISDWTSDDVIFDHGTFVMPANDVLITASSETTVYTVTYVTNGGSSLPADTYTIVSKTLVLPRTSVRYGYAFTDWFDNDALSGTPVKEVPSGSIGDRTFYAKWEPNVYSVTLISDPESIGSFRFTIDNEPEQIYTGQFTVKHDQSLIVNAFASEGYSFYEWDDHSKMTARISSPVTGDITWTAKYLCDHYTVTYTVNGEQYGNAESVLYGEEVTLRDRFVRTGYTVSEWESSDVYITAGKFIMPSRNVVIKASAVPISYTISFRDNGSTGGTSVSDISAVYDETYTAPECTWVKDYYSFTAWNTAQNGFGTSYDVGSELMNLASDTATVILYAQWIGNVYEVTLDKSSMGGTDGIADVRYNGGVVDMVKPVREGYVVDGYYTGDNVRIMNSSGKLIPNIDGYTDNEGKWVAHENVTLYTHWSEIPKYTNVWTLVITAILATAAIGEISVILARKIKKGRQG